MLPISIVETCRKVDVNDTNREWKKHKWWYAEKQEWNPYFEVKAYWMQLSFHFFPDKLGEKGKSPDGGAVERKQF